MPKGMQFKMNKMDCSSGLPDIKAQVRPLPLEQASLEGPRKAEEPGVLIVSWNTGLCPHLGSTYRMWAWRWQKSKQTSTFHYWQGVLLMPLSQIFIYYHGNMETKTSQETLVCRRLIMGQRVGLVLGLRVPSHPRGNPAWLP